jgi:hypothetical protein
MRPEAGWWKFIMRPNALTVRNSLNYRWIFYTPLNLGEEIF